MNVNEQHPYRAFTLAAALFALPLAMLLFETVTVWLRKQSGLWLERTTEGITPSANWTDGTVWFVITVLALFALLLGGGLGKLARNKMMRRRFRYILFLCGAAACAASFLAAVLLGVLGEAALGGHAQTAVFYYTAAIGMLAALLLPKQLTRAPEQTITFHKPKR
ncbi:hypothetical protein [Neisseria animalis]|uniref:Integral membrane protein n=1 Tax=Neisseria animalis TaxID=492 RepID=A0A5P3MQK8_NEIAN|nr:hypothetical protein [Neisseria animalis]QEY23808.1 hypothetical protein D0T90_04235 [Neisseria animalis]ROW31588.1 hypothetical protein CGZ60_09440 [Neisseria animalis]VEE09770.1 integral membrane protein [Neisseria animalis]